MHNFHTISGLRDQISREILVGIVIFFAFQNFTSQASRDPNSTFSFLDKSRYQPMWTCFTLLYSNYFKFLSWCVHSYLTSK